MRLLATDGEPIAFAFSAIMKIDFIISSVLSDEARYFSLAISSRNCRFEIGFFDTLLHEQSFSVNADMNLERAKMDPSIVLDAEVIQKGNNIIEREQID